MAKAAEHAKKEPITGRPADLLKPEWEKLRADALALKGCNGTDEDVLTYAMFPQVAPKFFKTRAEGPKISANTLKRSPKPRLLRRLRPRLRRPRRPAKAL